MKKFKPIKYHPGIFDKYKELQNLDEWRDFPDLMWGLGFDMDCGKTFEEFSKNCGLKLKNPENAREEKKNCLYVLEHAERQIVGDFLFSHWRYLTHWVYFYDKYDVDFLLRIIGILESKY